MSDAAAIGAAGRLRARLLGLLPGRSGPAAADHGGAIPVRDWIEVGAERSPTRSH